MGKKTRMRQESESQKRKMWEDSLRNMNPKQKHYKRAEFDRSNARDRLMLTLSQYKMSFVRDPKKWKCRSYNPETQRVELLRYLFCKYPVPKFFFEAFDENPHFVQREWFYAVAQGGSFRKMAREWFTAKEAHLFLQGPKERGIDNFWWAKCKVRNIPESLMTVILLRKTVTSTLAARLDFIAKYADQLDRETLSELYDFWMDNRELTFEGRTLASMIRLSNEWHRDVAIKQNHKQFTSWDGLGIPDWHHDDDLTNRLWTVFQLKNSKDLNREGSIQRHCVSVYHGACSSGYTSIFTLHSLDENGTERKHVTIEVSNANRSIVQVRGKLNRKPDTSETRMVRAWASANGLQVTTYCMR